MNTFYFLMGAADACARGLACYLYKIPADKATIFNGVDIVAQVVTYFVLNHVLVAPKVHRKGQSVYATIVTLVGSTLVGLVAGVFVARRMQVNPWAASITSSLSGVIGVCVVILLKEQMAKNC
jgi:membrane associated rhomboid family serine protease